MLNVQTRFTHVGVIPYPRIKLILCTIYCTEYCTWLHKNPTGIMDRYPGFYTGVLYLVAVVRAFTLGLFTYNTHVKGVNAIVFLNVYDMKNLHTKGYEHYHYTEWVLLLLCGGWAWYVGPVQNCTQACYSWQKCTYFTLRLTVIMYTQKGYSCKDLVISEKSFTPK